MKSLFEGGFWAQSVVSSIQKNWTEKHCYLQKFKDNSKIYIHNLAITFEIRPKQ